MGRGFEVIKSLLFTFIHEFIFFLNCFRTRNKLIKKNYPYHDQNKYNNNVYK